MDLTLRTALSPDPAFDQPVPARERTVTLLFIDIEGSTRLLQDLGAHYGDLLVGVRSIIRRIVGEEGGREVDTAGDGFFGTFPSARGAVSAAAAIQREITSQAWPGGARPRVRIGIHTGEPVAVDGSYVGIDVHRTARICSSASGGQTLLSAAARTLVGGDLPPDVSLLDAGMHRLKDVDHPEHLFQLVLSDVPGSEAPVRIAEGSGGSLPVQLSSFVGRTLELERLVGLIEQHRLVTLTGPGGTGKTRLAIEAASRLRERFFDGVLFVALASERETTAELSAGPNSTCCALGCDDACEVVSRGLGRSLGLTDNPMQPVLEQVKDVLRHQSVLVLLDNFEQLINAAHLVSDLLSAAPGMHVVVTSRSPLRLIGEHEVAVPPLSLPAVGRTARPLDLDTCDAVQLFMGRARAVRGDFEITDENAGAVAEICIRLDGLPLAIELAAARIKVLSPEAILQRLSGRLQLLTGGGRDRPARHQTIRQTIAWSYDLLEEAEKAYFRRLAVFKGGFTLHAAEHAAASLPGLGIDALDAISALIDKSLLCREDDLWEEPRFRMLETIRDFGWECLIENGEAEAAQRAHAEYFLSYAREAAATIMGIEQRATLDRLEVDHDNFRAAIDWTIARDDAELGLGTAISLWRFWVIRGHLLEGRDQVERLLALPSAQEPSELRARALDAAATIIHEISDYATARRLSEESLEIWRSLGHLRGIGSALNNLSWIAALQGDFDVAIEWAEESERVHGQLGDDRGLAVAGHNLAAVYVQQAHWADARALIDRSIDLRRRVGDERGVAYEYTMRAWLEMLAGDVNESLRFSDQAVFILRAMNDRQLLAWALSIRGRTRFEAGDLENGPQEIEESIGLWREVGNRGGLTGALADLSIVHCASSEFERAVAVAEEAVALAGFIGRSWFTMSARHALAWALNGRGDRERALSLHRENLEIRRRLKNALGMADSLEGAAEASADDPESAARLLGAADALRASALAPRLPSRATAHEALVSRLRGVLGDDRFEQAMNAGRMRSSDQIGL